MCESAVWFEGLGQTHSCRCLRDWLTSDGFTTCLGFACLVAGVTAGTESHALCHPTDCPEMVHKGVVVFLMKVPWCLLCSSWNTEIYTYISNHIKENKQDFFPYQHISSLVSSFELIRFNGKVRNRRFLHLCASLLPKVPQIFAAFDTSHRNLRYFIHISSYFQQGQWYQAILLYLEVEILEGFFFF